MVTIHLTQFNYDESDKASDCASIVRSLLGDMNKKIEWKEDESDAESSFDVMMVYNEMQMTDLDVWDELMDLGMENEIYVIVYDHQSKIRRGYWYDEEEGDWVDMDMSDDDFYTKSMA